MESGDEYLRQLEDKAEDLITEARNVGAKADYRFVRSYMLKGRKISSPATYLLAISHLEGWIAASNREKEKRACQRSLVVKFKNLIGIG